MVLHDVSLTLGATKRMFNTSSRFGTTWPRRRRREYIAREIMNHTSSPLSLPREILRALQPARTGSRVESCPLVPSPRRRMRDSIRLHAFYRRIKKNWRQLGSSNPKRLFALSNVGLCDIFASSVNKMIIIALHMFNCLIAYLGRRLPSCLF